MRFLQLFHVSAMLATLGACGSLDDLEKKQNLATLKGRIVLGSSSAAPAVSSSLRVAIVWQWPDRNLAGERFTTNAADFYARFSS